MYKTRMYLPGRYHLHLLLLLLFLILLLVPLFKDIIADLMQDLFCCTAIMEFIIIQLEREPPRRIVA